MAAIIPEQFKDLFEKKAFANLATLMPDGHPQVTPVWVDMDGNEILVNSARGRVKDRNVRRDPRVTVTLIDPQTRTMVVYHIDKFTGEVKWEMRDEDVNDAERLARAAKRDAGAETRAVELRDFMAAAVEYETCAPTQSRSRDERRLERRLEGVAFQGACVLPLEGIADPRNLGNQNQLVPHGVAGVGELDAQSIERQYVKPILVLGRPFRLEERIPQRFLVYRAGRIDVERRTKIPTRLRRFFPAGEPRIRVGVAG